MGDKESLLQSAALFAIVLLCDFLERRRPARRVDRRHDLLLNIAALLIVIVAGEIWKGMLLNGLEMFNPGEIPFLSGLRGLPGGVKIALGIIAADFCLYWVHRAMHGPGLWRTHAFHHSISELWWLSGSRTSTLHLLLFALPQVFLAYYILDLSPGEAGVAFSFGVVVNVWIHTNIWVDLGPLEWLLITPNYHRMHHGAKGLSRKNLGFVLTIWDRVFGTYADPRVSGKDIPLGFVPTRKRLLRLIIGF
ncbi:MAG TPA: sterol desaturase family protein [Dissulfurispiraceae bacterium]